MGEGSFLQAMHLPLFLQKQQLRRFLHLNFR
jgi:hypothetical protein